ncbi:MAG TPA: exodeoxyribonuclease VII small subunit [Thermoanaerobaculia bacterium]|nr:exodeoxyribonuclease VII small subunit [Thermoanaerobaculia bacterium]
MTKTKALPKNLSFEKALERLQEIVAELEDPEKGLEASLELFEEGVALSRFCRSRIDEIQKRVDVVLKESPEGLVTGPLDEDADDEADDGNDEDAAR